ncbi:ImmA/IrrE family metallo-endopeptidase [Arthrobacter ruber]|uniref:ImmA/IrrE family metallo-endopeptidase n=1 Tax=Arthrobacter ruber TaxID=1258893 RepID=UPI000CF3C62F|nr:ImmA/IrrE family metallo-endopeptidase [Arthrobacter ruber]
MMTAASQVTSDWTPYAPDQVSSPGATLRETLETLPLSQTDLATRTGLSIKHINQIVSGSAALTHETAIKLERATGVPAKIWNTLEANYRDAISRMSERESLSASKEWLRLMPVAALRKKGVVTATLRDPGTLLQEILQFFGVSSIEAWEEAWAKPSAAFLQSSAFEADPGAVAAWLRLGEQAAIDVDTAPFDRARLKAAIPRLRALTVLSPEAFWPQVVAICADAGVAVVLVPEVPGARAHGATRWLSPTKALVQLSVRHKRNDHLWFALFHELGHVLLHGKKEVFVEHKLGADGGRTKQEKEANEFAGNTLLPPSAEQKLKAVTTYSDVRRLAEELGVHPGVVAGRIQHDRGNYSFGVPDLFVSLRVGRDES